VGFAPWWSCALLLSGLALLVVVRGASPAVTAVMASLLTVALGDFGRRLLSPPRASEDLPGSGQPHSLSVA
jgi:hypothetical protein